MYKELEKQLWVGLLSAPILYVPHYHYELISEALHKVARPELTGINSTAICEWDICKGPMRFGDKQYNSRFPYKTFDNWIKVLSDADTEAKVFIIRSAESIISSVEGLAALQLFAQRYERKEIDSICTIILVSTQPVSSLPVELNRIVNVIEVLPPTEQEIVTYLINENIKVSSYYRQESARNDLMKRFVRTLQGLQMYEVKQIVRTSLQQTNRTIVNDSIEYALVEKRKIVEKSGIVEVVRANESFEEIGGLSILKKDLENKAVIYNNLSRVKDLNIPYPKGCLIIGMPGCGKSMIAKAIANKFGVSLLRLDVNRLMGSYVGQSEQNLRQALQIAEAAHPCVLWIDEIEKAFAGTNNSGGHGEGDSLVLRLMGHFLTWMQERKDPVYVVATANGVMRPEFMRKGRFDDVYFVDFPSFEERIDILEKKMSHFRNTEECKVVFNLSDLLSPTDSTKWNPKALGKISEQMNAIKEGKDDKKTQGGFSGAEIAALVNTVFEDKFVEYLSLEKAAREKGDEVSPIKVTTKDFCKLAQDMKESAMCNQKGKKADTSGYEKSAIEEIREMNSLYHFTPASESK